jgi:hypothetical protein
MDRSFHYDQLIDPRDGVFGEKGGSTLVVSSTEKNYVFGRLKCKGKYFRIKTAKDKIILANFQNAYEWSRR